MINNNNIKPTKVFKKRKYWIAFSSELKIFGYSDKSKKDALRDFKDAVKTYFYVKEKLKLT